MTRMTPAELAEHLKGKTIKEIDYGSYMHWDMTIESIEFTDGTQVFLGGNADNAHVDFIVNEHGDTIGIKENE